MYITFNVVAETLFTKNEKSKKKKKERNHDNILKLLKENDNFPATEPKDMKYCNLMDKRIQNSCYEDIQ